MSARTNYEARAESYLEQARLFYEPHLAAQGLSEKTINDQTLEQLRDSLAKLEIAMAHPEQFGFFRIKIAAEGASIIVKNPNRGSD